MLLSGIATIGYVSFRISRLFVSCGLACATSQLISSIPNETNKVEAMMYLRDNILYLRNRDGYTQEQLAEKLSVSRQSVAKWESGNSYPELEKLLVLSEIFNVSVDDLLQKNPGSPEEVIEDAVSDDEESTDNNDMDAPEDPKENSEGSPIDRPETTLLYSPIDSATQKSAYEQEMKSFALRVASGVMAILIGVTLTVFTESVIVDPVGSFATITNEYQPDYEFGAVFVLIGVLIGILLFIPAGMSHSNFVKNNPYLAFSYSSEEISATHKLLSKLIAPGVALILLGVILTITLDAFGIESGLPASLLLLCVSIATFGFIYGGIYCGRINIKKYNLDAATDLPKEDVAPVYSRAGVEYPEKQAEAGKFIGLLCGIIMLVATAIGLLLLFIPHYEYFWLVWPIGGISCGIVSMLAKMFNHQIA